MSGKTSYFNTFSIPGTIKEKKNFQSAMYKQVASYQLGNEITWLLLENNARRDSCDVGRG